MGVNIINNNIIHSFLLSFLTALVSGIFFFISFWILPFLQSSSNTPTASVFLLGNLIVAVLVGESKMFSPKTCDSAVDDDDDCLFDGSFGECSIGEMEDDCDEGERIDEWEMSNLGDREELSRRADDFIARVNMQRKIEATILSYGCEWTTMNKKYRRRRICLKQRF
ncbi:uncharacterized protein LOC111008810 [Momordica charantia]|uniref:Uncharacterized protein LOC111008810 n=1 Tax=Momordica charantia TaxID=3673 RepID=A0A6J1CA01_MOMCH|nr:uncharacterized protein LOC111008810 [Momordica charantia]